MPKDMVCPGAGSRIEAVAWDSSERLAVAVQNGAEVHVLLYATELRPMMTAHLLGMLQAPCLKQAHGNAVGTAQSTLSMRGTNEGSLLAVHRHGPFVSLIPLLYKGL